MSNIDNNESHKEEKIDKTMVVEFEPYVEVIAMELELDQDKPIPTLTVKPNTIRLTKRPPLLDLREP